MKQSGTLLRWFCAPKVLWRNLNEQTNIQTNKQASGKTSKTSKQTNKTNTKQNKTKQTNTDTKHRNLRNTVSRYETGMKRVCNRYETVWRCVVLLLCLLASLLTCFFASMVLWRNLNKTNKADDSLAIRVKMCGKRPLDPSVAWRVASKLS